MFLSQNIYNSKLNSEHIYLNIQIDANIWIIFYESTDQKQQNYNKITADSFRVYTRMFSENAT